MLHSSFCVLQLSRAHREHYCDKTGTVQKVEHFQLPAPVEDAFKKDVSLYAISVLSIIVIDCFSSEIYLCY